MLLWTDIQNMTPMDANYSLKTALYVLYEHNRSNFNEYNVYCINCITLMLLTAFNVTCD